MNIYQGHEFVDLSLPSGTLWATCNMGANKPEEYGDYYAWGEIKPKNKYDANSYKYIKENNILPKTNFLFLLTKYCQESNFGYAGFTDELTVLESVDDAATVNWGNGWCIPSKEQWEELIKNTENTWTTRNGVNGRLFSAKNDQTLFLPAAGFRWNDELNRAGSYGGYCSSTLRTDRPDLVWDFFFKSDRYRIFDDFRGDGLSVRPVRSARQN